MASTLPNMTRLLAAALLSPIVLFAQTSGPTYRVVAPFPGHQAYPLSVAPLVESRAGGIYGIFDEGRPASRVEAGGIFRLQNGECKVVHRFKGSGGYVPVSLFAGQDGSLYGQCISGGEYQEGTFWRFDTAKGVFHKISDRLPIADSPYLTGITPDGLLYGRSSSDLFLSTPNGEMEKFFSFASLPAAPAGQVTPSYPRWITLASDGAFYGTTYEGGALVVSTPYSFSRGVFFRATTSGEYELIAEFNESTGPAPSQIVEGSDGAFYGLSRNRDSHPILLRLSKAGAMEVIREFPDLPYGPSADLHVFAGPDRCIYAEVSRTSSAFESFDIVLRYNPETQVSELIQYTGEERGRSLLLTSKGELFSSYQNRKDRGSVSVLSGLEFGPFNRLPFARADRFAIRKGASPITLNPLRNDGDRDGEKLTITSVGTPVHGTVSIAEGGRRLIYTPGSGNVLSDSFTYTVNDGNERGNATARVSLNVAGPSRSYAGLTSFRGAPVYLQATVSYSGQLTGFIIPLGKKVRFRGALDEARSFTQTTPVDLNVTDTELLIGELKTTITETPPAGSDPAELKLELELNGETTTTRFSPIPSHTDASERYTIVMPPFDPLAGSSQKFGRRFVSILTQPGERPKNLCGAGWATLTVTNRGYARLTGKLGDGRTISFGGPFSDQLRLPVYAHSSPMLPISPMPPRGFFAGTLAFNGESVAGAEPDCSGVFRWTRPWIDLGLSLFQMGFAVMQPVTGYAYEQPSEPLVPPIVVDRSLMKIELSEIPPLKSAKSLVYVEDTVFRSRELNATLNLNESSGSVFGILEHPELSAPGAASGVLIPQLKQVIGVYKTPYGTGKFVIKPQ